MGNWDALAQAATISKPCQCEHAVHFEEGMAHRYLAVPAGRHRAMHVGLVCDNCASTHLHEWLVKPKTPFERGITAMGTRALTGFVTGDTIRTVYSQYDGYPDGLGLAVFKWGLTADYEDAKAKLLAAEVVNESDEPAPEQLEKLLQRGAKPDHVSTGTDWYAWLHHTQGDPQAILDFGYIADVTDYWPMDSLFCEWGWIVDLDQRVLECYQGFNQAPAKGRFGPGEPDDGGYYPITLTHTVPLDGSVDEAGFLELFGRRP
jgi:hypothetical protein